MEKEAKDREIPFKPIKLNFFPRQLKAHQELWTYDVEELVYGGGAGGGKIVADDSAVLTPFGFKQGSDLEVGDLINDPDGGTQKIIQIKPRVELERWTVSFSDGTSLPVAKDHLWLAWRARKGRKIRNEYVTGIDGAEVVETRQLKEWLERGYSPLIPVCKEQSFNITSKYSKLDPYLLGILLGDGCITSNNMQVACSVEDLAHYKQVFGEREKGITYDTNQPCCRFTGDWNREIKRLLRRYGLLGCKSHNKFIPDIYKYGSVEDRYKLVRGLMDTDGYSAPDKNAVYYYSVSKKLAEDVAFCIRSLGGVVTMTKKETSYCNDAGSKVRCKDCYCLYIKHRMPDLLFSLDRKKHGFSRSSLSKRVVSVDVGGKKVTGRCITVSSPHGLYVTDDFIVTHNSYWIALEILYMVKMFPGCRIGLGRNQLKDLKETTLLDILSVFEKYGLKKGRDYNYKSNAGQIEVYPTKCLIFLKELTYNPSDAEFNRLGSTAFTAFFIEEAQEVTQAARVAINSRLRHKTKDYGIKGKLVMTCNPGKNFLKTDFYNPWREGKLENHKRFIPALVTDNLAMDKNYIEKLRRLPDKNQRERLLKGNWDYEDAHNQVVPYFWLEESIVPDYKADINITVGVDVARRGGDAIFAAIMIGHTLYDLRRIEVEITAHSDIGTLVAKEIIRICRSMGAEDTDLVLDVVGIGSSVIDALHRMNWFPEEFIGNSKAEWDHGLWECNNKRSESYWQLRDDLQKHLLHIYKDVSEKNKLFDEVTAHTYQIKNGNIVVCPKDEVKDMIQRSPDRADAVVMANWHYNKRCKKSGKAKYKIGTAEYYRARHERAEEINAEIAANIESSYSFL